MARLIGLATFTALTCGCAQLRQVPHSLDQMAIYSWHPKHQPWHFMVYPDAGSPPSRAEITRAHHMVGVAALKAYIAWLLPGTSLPWRYESSLGLVWPDERISTEVVQFAHRHSVRILLLPTIEEDEKPNQALQPTPSRLVSSLSND